MIKNSVIYNELQKFGYYVSTASGTSMYPLLRNSKDQVMIEPLKTQPKKFDVVLYRTNAGKYVLHRVIDIKNGTFIIRGDNLYSKEYISENDIVGKMTYFWRGRKKHNCKSLTYKAYICYLGFSYPVRLLHAKIGSLFSMINHNSEKRCVTVAD